MEKEKKQVCVSVTGTVVDWSREVQVGKAGEEFDFNGVLIQAKEKKAEEKPAEKSRVYGRL